MLNILYLCCCIPIVTIGAATTALYYTTLKMAENKESYIWRDYWSAFKTNFRQSTILWIIMLVGLLILATNIVMAGGIGQTLGSIVAVVSIAVGCFAIVSGVYVFPILARFDNSIVNTMKNALIMSVRHLFATVVIALIRGLPLILGMVSIQVLINGIGVILLFFVSMLAYLESKIFIKVFVKYYPKTEDYDLLQKNTGGFTLWQSKQR